MRIHYNVTGAERKRLVNAIVDTIGAKANYKGMPSAAYEIDYFTVTKDGTLEFSDCSDTEEVEMVILALEAAGFDGVGELHFVAFVPVDRVGLAVSQFHILPVTVSVSVLELPR